MPLPAQRITPATHVRGSVLCTSLGSLRKRGLGDRYYAVLDPRWEEAMRSMTAAVWAPLPLAVAHYEACDRLQLSVETIESIGSEAGEMLNAAFVGVVVRVSREMGANPWTVLANMPRLNDRLWRGGAFAVYKLGPKEARLEWHGQPVAASPYYRVAFGAFASAVLKPFCRSLFVRQLPQTSDHTTIAYRVSWA